MSARPDSIDPGFDRLNRDWYIDKAVQLIVFIGGISAIIFIIGIFVFITKEGFGFLIGDFNFREFFVRYCSIISGSSFSVFVIRVK